MALRERKRCSICPGCASLSHGRSYDMLTTACRPPCPQKSYQKVRGCKRHDLRSSALSEAESTSSNGCATSAVTQRCCTKACKTLQALHDITLYSGAHFDAFESTKFRKMLRPLKISTASPLTASHTGDTSHHKLSKPMAGSHPRTSMITDLEGKPH